MSTDRPSRPHFIPSFDSRRAFRYAARAIAWATPILLAVLATDVVLARNPQHTGLHRWRNALNHALRIRPIGGQPAASAQATVASVSLPGSAQARSLAAGDFHEDGAVDLISGFGDSGGGYVVLQRANLDVQQAHGRIGEFRPTKRSPGAEPFLPGGAVVAVPAAPDFLGVGDFNNDGHLDLVLASRGGNAVYMLPGDGHGGFGAAQRIGLPGAVTALVAGEINRADGLADFVVGVNAPQGPRVMVFESPLGAWRAQSEVFSLPASAESMALGRFHGNYTVDLAVAVGSQVLFIEGRDRKLILDESLRPAVPQASVSRLSFPLSISSLAKGDFDGTGQEHLGVLLTDGSLHRVAPAPQQETGKPQGAPLWESAELASGAGNRAARMVAGRVSGRGGDDLILLDRWRRQVHIQSAGPWATRTSLDMQDEPVAALAVRPSGSATTRLVVLQAGQSTPTQLSSGADPTFTVTNTNDSGAGSLRQAILNANANTSGGNLINFNIPGTGPFTIMPATTLPPVSSPGSTIDATTQPGHMTTPIVQIKGSALGVPSSGIIVMAKNCGIRGLAITNFAGQGFSGIAVSPTGSALIRDNFIGIALDGKTGAPNENGIQVSGSSSTITNNVISGNKNNGVEIDGANGNTVSGNFIGVDVNGNSLGSSHNGGYGVFISGSSMNIIGGINAGDANVISGNFNGIVIISTVNKVASTGNVIQGNFIGTDPTGTKAVPNSITGILIVDSPNNTIGGTAPGAQNVISSNGSLGTGIEESGSTNDILNGNIFGLDETGTNPLPNGGSGVVVDMNASNNIVGGSVPGAGNKIGANRGNGAMLGPGTFSNTILGNSIVGNTGNGVGTNNSSDNTVGPGNTITGNAMAGVLIDSGTVATKITQNFIYNNVGPPAVLQPGGNFNLNSAHIASAISGADSVTVQGTLSQVPAGNYVIEVFGGDTPTSAGKIFLGQTGVTVGPGGTGTFSATFTIVGGLPGGFVSGTVTDSIMDTSAYAAAVQVQATASGPTISSVAPSSGSPLTPLTLTGTGFSGITFLNIGSLSATFTAPSDTQIKTSVPATAPPGPTSIVVGGPNGTASIPFIVTSSCPAITVVGGNAQSPATVGLSAAPSTVTASGGTPPYTFSAVGLPPGLRLNPGAAVDATVSGTPTQAGTYKVTITATDAHGCTGSETFPFVVTDQHTTIFLGSSANPSVFGQGVIFNATVSETGGGTLTPTGSVQLAIDGSNLGAPIILVNGAAAFPVITTLLPGTHSVQLSYPGDSNNFPSSATLSQNVNRANTTEALLIVDNPGTYGVSNTLTVDVIAAPPGAGVPAGVVNLKLNGVLSTSAPLSSSGTAVFSLTNIPAGSYTVEADYPGSTNDNASFIQATYKQLLSRTIDTLTSSFDPSNLGQSVQFTATVSEANAGANTPTGTGQFQVDGINLGILIPLVKGTATSPSTSTLTAGPHIVTFNYGGDPNNSASTGALTQEVGEPDIFAKILSRSVESGGLESWVLSFTNTGPADALGVSVNLATKALAGSGKVAIVTPLPLNLGNVKPGGQTTAVIELQATGTVTRTELFVNLVYKDFLNRPVESSSAFAVPWP